LGVTIAFMVFACGCKSWPFQHDRRPADRDVISPPQTITPFGPSDPKPSSDAPPVNWSDAKPGINIDAPSVVAPGQDLSFRMDVTNRSPVTVRHTVPNNVQILGTNPPARLSGNELIWDLLPAGDARQSINVVYRPANTGVVNLRAEAFGADGLRHDAQATTQIGTGRIAVQVSGPNEARPGDRVAYDVRLVNSGQSPIAHVVLRAELDNRLDHESGYRELEIPIEMLQPGEAKFVQLPVTVRNGGRLRTVISAKADGGVSSQEEKTLEVRDSRMQLTVAGPTQVVLNRTATWTATLVNSGSLPVQSAHLRIMLPSELRFSSVSAGGRAINGVVTWSVDSLRPGEQRQFEMTATPITAIQRTTLVATATTDGGVETRADQPLEIIGIPLMKLTVSDSEDRVEVGRRVVYTAEIRNAGSLPLEEVNVTATLSPALKPVFGFGPSVAQINGDKVTFATIERIEPNRSVVFRFEAEAISPADARVTVEAQCKTIKTPVLADEATRVVGPRS